LKIYFAGAEASLNFFEKINVKNILIAYPFLKRKKINIEKEFFIDSGAFSAYTKGVKIDIEEYIEFIKLKKCKIYAGLDVIGDAEKTKKNILYMKKNGLNEVLPTFHYGEDFKYFEYYLKEFDYIALGGLVKHKSERIKIKKWFNLCFSYLKKFKNKKIHGFGVTNWEYLCSYPFYSVDSTSWQNPHRYGQHFNFEKGKLKRIDFKKISINKFFNKEEQLRRSVENFLKAEGFLTKLWEKRGIVWND